MAKGQAFDHEIVAAAMTEARAGLAVQLEAFAANTMEYLRRERELLLDGVGVPDITTQIDGRHALIVVRGYHYKEDLQTLRQLHPRVPPGPHRRRRRRRRAARGRAQAGPRSSATWTRCPTRPCAAAPRSSSTPTATATRPGLERVRRLGVEPVVFPATGTSEDVAMLLADDKGAELIVAVGTHATLVEFLDKGRSGMASTFLTRLRVGGKLVDAKGVSRLYRSRISNLTLIAHAPRRAQRAVRRALVDDGWACPPAGPRRSLGRPVVLRRRNRHVIDFRYHLVSIVSIFLALAVGIVLGAGPLKEDLGNTLTSEVKNLRADKADLRTELDQADARAPRPATSSPPRATAACWRRASPTRPSPSSCCPAPTPGS